MESARNVKYLAAENARLRESLASALKSADDLAETYERRITAVRAELMELKSMVVESQHIIDLREQQQAAEATEREAAAQTVRHYLSPPNPIVQTITEDGRERQIMVIIRSSREEGQFGAWIPEHDSPYMQRLRQPISEGLGND